MDLENPELCQMLRRTWLQAGLFRGPRCKSQVVKRQRTSRKSPKGNESSSKPSIFQVNFFVGFQGVFSHLSPGNHRPVTLWKALRLVMRGLTDLTPDSFASFSRHFGPLGPVPAGREHAKLGPGGVRDGFGTHSCFEGFCFKGFRIKLLY